MQARNLVSALIALTVILPPLVCPQDNTEQIEKNISPIAIVIHGGAGTISRAAMTAELEEQYRAKLTEALQAGYAILEKGGSSLDAVETAVVILEDSPLFNAGKGAVLTSNGQAELDASIMDGRTLDAGAVTVLRHVKNPIRLARIVMERSPHVMLAGQGAEEFAVANRIEMVDPSYFLTERRIKELQRAKEKEENKKKQRTAPDTAGGTVGCVALDRSGNLAAATSTGGKTNKYTGRIGDSPVIGAGNYADNRTCAISGTGDGECFIRGVLAYDISALMLYEGMTLRAAAEEVVMSKLKKLGGTGGVIGLDVKGNIAMPFNTEGMYRGFIDKDGKLEIYFYRD